MWSEPRELPPAATRPFALPGHVKPAGAQYYPLWLRMTGPQVYTCGPKGDNSSYWQEGNLKDAILVLQLKDPFAFRY